MPAGRPTKYDPAMCDDLVSIMSEGASITEAAARLGIVRETVYAWAADPEKPDFSDALKRGLQLSQAWWEAQGRKAVCGQVDGFPQSAFIFTMKNRFREDYPDTQRNELTGKNGDPLTILLSEIADQPSSSPMARLRAEDDD